VGKHYTRVRGVSTWVKRGFCTRQELVPGSMSDSTADDGEDGDDVVGAEVLHLRRFVTSSPEASNYTVVA
jgi:hypothetical protein